MQVTDFEIEGLKLITPKVFEDERGYFVERYKSKAFAELGLPENFVQDNYSYSKPKVLRGLHYQYSPSQGKLVTCLSGKIYDVAVDIRKDSPTFGRHQGVILSGESPSWFWLPAGFAHGFSVMEEAPATVLYKVNNPYGPAGEGAIAWNDKSLNIQWPGVEPIINSKDGAAESFIDYSKAPKF